MEKNLKDSFLQQVRMLRDISWTEIVELWNKSDP